MDVGKAPAKDATTVPGCSVKMPYRNDASRITDPIRDSITNNPIHNQKPIRITGWDESDNARRAA